MCSRWAPRTLFRRLSWQRNRWSGRFDIRVPDCQISVRVSSDKAPARDQLERSKPYDASYTTRKRKSRDVDKTPAPKQTIKKLKPHGIGHWTRERKPQDGGKAPARQQIDRDPGAHDSSDRKREPQILRGARSAEEVHFAKRYRPLSAVLLRDQCSCAQCVDGSTRQKLFATADIPEDIRAKQGDFSRSGSVRWQWENDIQGYGPDHTTEIPIRTLDQLLRGQQSVAHPPLSRMLWDAQMYERQNHDIEYDAYMEDDSVLYRALQQLHEYGLLFLCNVPSAATSVEAIGERIGPLKTTFYGRTWDVRSVPEAKNVAYTAQNLGFHMDLMYMKQPPHVQLLHCIRSSAMGGASLFSDSFKAVSEIGQMRDPTTWKNLSRLAVGYHYNHNDSQYYYQTRPVIEQESILVEGTTWRSWEEYRNTMVQLGNTASASLTPADFISHVAWSPPFQAPFGHSAVPNDHRSRFRHTAASLNARVEEWLRAAKVFSELIHRPDAIYERMMKPGECVIFDNRRVLHARKAFEVGDQGAERWLRGAYLDKDPYTSRLKILNDQYQGPSRIKYGRLL